MNNGNNEIRVTAELTMRRLQAEPGADTQAIARAFEPLMNAIATAEQKVRRYETKG
jgi:hypothetical protein